MSPHERKRHPCTQHLKGFGETPTTRAETEHTANKTKPRKVLPKGRLSTTSVIPSATSSSPVRHLGCCWRARPYLRRPSRLDGRVPKTPHRICITLGGNRSTTRLTNTC